MKKSFLIILLACLGVACQQKKEVINTEQEVKTPPPPARVVKKDARKIGPGKAAEQVLIDEAIEKLNANINNDPAVGYWVGMFGKNKINIAIAEVKDGNALGYTVCAGNFRPITGTVSMKKNVYDLDMNEPGTDQYDGHFVFSITPETGTLEGTWSPFKKGIVGNKTYTLRKTPYIYQPESGIYPQASAQLLNEEDVANLREEELEFMRNEIYARHGYSFKVIEDRRQFDTVAWYIPMGIDIREKLTDIEVQNIDLIYRYEEYYEESYDDYGR
jgi:hypothetical protein